MIGELKPYPAMKDSGVEWLGEVPEHWEVRRLRNVAGLRVSNIDKHSRDGEEPVRLCNYVDVYKHDRITPEMAFMKATATRAEVERFRLHVDDVLITKDSETWNDIGVPSLVDGAADDLVSGYHLALLRPFQDRIKGGFLFRMFQSSAGAYQFHVEAKGVTRYGLAHGSIKSVALPVPPIPEQAAIARFLDHADRRIRRYIRAKQKLIKLLEEQKQAIIHRAVTRGLDPDVPLKDSGVEWLGEVPEHWKVVRLKFIAAQIADCLHATPVYSEDGEYPAIRTADVQPGKVNIESARRVEERQYQRWTSRMVPQGGDILYSREGERFGIAAPVPEGSRLCISQRMMTFRIRAEHHAGFIMWQINTRHVYAQAAADQIGAAAPHVNVGRIRNFELVLPPRWEQEQIDEHIAAALIAPDKAIEQARREIRLLRELRTRLIADVVTGKLDVRQVAARLPEDDGDTVDEADYLDEDEPALEDMDLEAELEEIEA